MIFGNAIGISRDPSMIKSIDP